MDDVIQFLLRHGEAVLFAAVFAEQAGLPVPAVPVLLAAGALAGAGTMNALLAIGLALGACLAGDLVWYELDVTVAGMSSTCSAGSLLSRIPVCAVRKTSLAGMGCGRWCSLSSFPE